MRKYHKDICSICERYINVQPNKICDDCNKIIQNIRRNEFGTEFIEK